MGTLIIRIGFWGGADMSLIRRRLQMSCENRVLGSIIL